MPALRRPVLIDGRRSRIVVSCHNVQNILNIQNKRLNGMERAIAIFVDGIWAAAATSSVLT